MPEAAAIVIALARLVAVAPAKPAVNVAPGVIVIRPLPRMFVVLALVVTSDKVPACTLIGMADWIGAVPPIVLRVRVPTPVYLMHSCPDECVIRAGQAESFATRAAKGQRATGRKSRRAGLRQG